MSQLFVEVSSLLSLLLWLLFYFKAWKAGGEEAAAAEGEGDALSAFNFLGRYAMEKLGWKADGSRQRQMLADLQVIYGEKRKDTIFFYKQAALYRDLTLILSFYPFALLLSPFLLLLISAFMALRYFQDSYRWKKEREAVLTEVKKEIPGMVTSLILFLRSGSLLNTAWEELAEGNEGPLYEEMREVAVKRGEGVSFKAAYSQFGSRFHIDSLQEVAMLVSQGFESGGNELVNNLYSLRSKIVSEQKRFYQKEADRASQQMIFPSLLIFINILLLVLLPVMAETLRF